MPPKISDATVLKTALYHLRGQTVCQEEAERGWGDTTICICFLCSLKVGEVLTRSDWQWWITLSCVIALVSLTLFSCTLGLAEGIAWEIKTTWITVCLWELLLKLYPLSTMKSRTISLSSSLVQDFAGDTCLFSPQDLTYSSNGTFHTFLGMKTNKQTLGGIHLPLKVAMILTLKKKIHHLNPWL